MRKFYYFWNFITKEEKLKFLLIILLYILQTLLEMVGIASVIPFVTFLLKPDALSNIPIISDIVNFKEIQFDNNFIIILCFIFFSIFLIKNLVIIFTNQITYKFIFSVRSRLYSDILKKIMHQNYLFFVKEGIPKIANILSVEVNNFAISIVKPVINLSSEILITFGIFYLIVIFGYLDGLLLLFPFIILIGLLLKKINKSIKNWSNLRISSNQKLISLKYNFINSIKEIIIYGKIKKIFNEFKLNLENLQRVDINNNVVSSLPKALLEQFIILVFIITILFLTFSGQTFDNIIITLSFYLAVAYRLVPSFNRIFIAYQGLKFGEPSISKLMEFNNLKKENFFIENKNLKEVINFSHSIELENISFEYMNKKNVIKNLNFKVKRLDFIGIFGESGSGKTTLINILTCLLKQTSGKILIDNNELKDPLNLRKYQNLFSISSQDTFLIDGTMRDNIIFGSNKDYSKDKIDEAIKFARLEKFVNQLDNGVETYIGSTIKQLSSGQKQRIAIARSIYSDREILVFDEATNALDEENEKIIFDNIKKLKQKKTVIIISII